MYFFKQHESWLIFFASLALFLYGLFNRECLGHEALLKIFTQEMLHSGPKIFPTLYGAPYAATPNTLSFFSYLATLLSGKLTTLSMLLPSAIASSASLALLYRITLPIDQAWGRISVLLALFTYQFFDGARSFSITPFLMLSSMWAFYLCNQNQKKYLALPLLLGFLIQGPLGLIITATAIWAFDISEHNWPQLKKSVLQTFLLLSILSLLLLMLATYQFGLPFAVALLREQIIFPIVTSAGILNPAQVLIQYAVSSVLALISIVLWYHAAPLKKTMLYRLLIWLLCSFMILGFCTNQHNLAMLLPITPAMVLLAGSLWDNASKIAKICVVIFHLFCLSLPFIALCLTVATIATMHLKNFSVHAHYFSAFCTLSLFACFSIFIFCHHPIRYSKTHVKTVISIGLASFLATMIFIVKPIEISLQQSKSFTVEIMMDLLPNETICFVQMDPDKQPLLFFAALPGSNTPHVTFAPNLAKPLAENVLYIMPTKFFDALSDKEKQKMIVVRTGQLGYHPMVAVRRD